MMKRILPIIIFVGLFVFLAKSLYQPQTNIPSPLIGKPMPTFSLSELNSDTSLTDNDILGAIVLLMYGQLGVWGANKSIVSWLSLPLTKP